MFSSKPSANFFGHLYTAPPSSADNMKNLLGDEEMAGWKVAERKHMERSFGVLTRAQEPEEERRERAKMHANMLHASNKHITPALIACPPSLSNLAHKVGHPLSALSQNLAHSRRINTGPAYTRRLQSSDWRIICAKET